MALCWDDLAKKIRSKGINGVIKAVIGKVYTRAYMYKLEIPTPLTFPDIKVKLEPLTLDRLETVYQVYSAEIPNDKYQLLQKRLEQDSTDKTYIIVDSLDQVYGYYHIAFGDGHAASVNYHVKAEPRTIYMFDDYTFMRWRGLGAHKISIWSRLQLALEQGYTTAVVVIKKGNLHSEQAYQRIGFTKCKELTYYNLTLFRRTFAREIE